MLFRTKKLLWADEVEYRFDRFASAGCTERYLIKFFESVRAPETLTRLVWSRIEGNVFYKHGESILTVCYMHTMNSFAFIHSKTVTAGQAELL